MLSVQERLLVRVLFFGFSTLHHLPTTYYLSTIDFTKSEDPRLWFYNYNKFNVFTCWFNAMLVLYYPVSCYCDWRSLRNEGNKPHVQLLNNIRDFSFITFIFPSVTFGGSLFWRLWLYDRELLCPETLDLFIPPLLHYVIHTYSILGVLFEMVFVPRKRPRDDVMYKIVGLGFIWFYLIMCFVYRWFGIFVYVFLGLLSFPQLMVVCIIIALEYYFFYHVQWWLTEWIQGRLGRSLKNE